MSTLSLRVLIVEDDPVAAVMLRRMVEQEGHSVCGVVSRGAEVQEAVLSLCPDALLMDIHLEDGLDGLTLTSELSRKMQVPVIVISGTSDPAVMARVADSGALGFIEKPVSAGALKVNLQIAVHHYTLEKSLWASERRHRSIFDNAAVGIYVCCPDGRYLTCNQAFASMLGYDNPAELISLLVAPDEQLYDEAGRREELLALLHEKGEAPAFESKVYGRDGDMLWIEEHCSAVLGKDGRFKRYEGVVVNVTARKQTEEAFQLAYQLLQSTMDSVRDAILVTDLQGYLIMANKTARELFGQELEEGAKVPCAGFTAPDSPYGRFVRDHAPHTGELRLERNAEIFWAEVAPYHTPGGIVIGAVHTLRHLPEDTDAIIL